MSNLPAALPCGRPETMKTSYESLEIERTGACATVWMNRPEVFNAFNEGLIADLTEAFTSLEADATVRVVVLAGRGRHFSAGADLHWMQRASVSGPAENLSDARRFADMLRTLAQLSKPTIARVHGLALGGGTGLVAACDMAVATNDAVFATSEVHFGIIPAVISPYVLRAIGPRQALRYFQSAERISVETALYIGLIHEVQPAEQIDAWVGTLVQALIKGAPNAQTAAKALIASISGRVIDSTLIEETAQRIAVQRTTPEALEGIDSFLAKRAPAWAA